VAVALLLAGCGALKRCAYEGFARDAWQQPERVVADLALAPGARVADLGAGGGYFTFRLAHAVGPTGLVYAVDVDPDMVDFLAEQAAEQGQSNVRPVLATTDDPRVPERVDLVFTSNTYHHLENRVAYFSALREHALSPGGRVAIVEYRPEATSHATARETIEQEMTAAGFRLEKSFDYLERQHFLVLVSDAANPEEPPR
jgi:predicted methyltransferase